MRELEFEYLFSELIPLYFYSNTIIIGKNGEENTLQEFININGIKIIFNEILFQKITYEVHQNSSNIEQVLLDIKRISLIKHDNLNIINDYYCIKK